MEYVHDELQHHCAIHDPTNLLRKRNMLQLCTT